MIEELWNFRHDFQDKPANDVYAQLISDDNNNYKRAQEALADDIRLVDQGLILYIEALQGAYREIKKWETQVALRASMAMLASTLNYLLLSRHSILMGYYPETLDLFRACYERISRALLFLNNEQFATQFIEGKEIRQSVVDGELSKIQTERATEKELFEGLRRYYKHLSRTAHPNLASFVSRYGHKDLEKNVGLSCIFGGLMSEDFGHVFILRLLQTVTSALRVVGVVAQERSGRWDLNYRSLLGQLNQMLDELK